MLPADVCTWDQDGDDSDVWATDCSHYFSIIEGTPAECGFRYCCYCGRPLVESPHTPDDEDEDEDTDDA